MVSTMVDVCSGGYDRMAELKAFDATKAGVKGVVDSGVKEVPRMFHAPPHHVEPGLPFSPTDPDYILPTIDLAAVHDPVKRKKTVEEIRDASESWGFFQIVNHGVPEKIQEELMARTQEFFEQDVEEKKKYMGADLTKKVVYSSNFDLYKSVCASWKDVIVFNMTPDPLQPDELPECFRESVQEYAAEMMKLGELLFELLSEALGLDKNHLKDIDCMEGFGLGCHYCPPCPQPELAIGVVPHADMSFLTIILQDQIGGLQVLHRGSWIDVPFVPGGMVVNTGDMFQLISNDRFKSALHRVKSKKTGPRISVPAFFGHGTTKSTRMYGSIKEMLSDNDPPKESVQEYAAEMMKLGELLFELLSEALGLDKNHLKDIDCMEGFGLGCHYCPPCPQPELAIGVVPHADMSFLTIILQDQIGGLQVLHRGSWIDVPFVPGGMVVNTGDMFQLISNDRFKSALHRVKSKKTGPRISVPAFFGHGTTKSTRMYGSIKEMLSDNDPPKYKETTIRDFFLKSFKKGANEISILPQLKIDNSAAAAAAATATAASV
ncbi:1-aminocyclopropane-1-carboxylate oxidase homolog 1 [Linum perenne]